MVIRHRKCFKSSHDYAICDYQSDEKRQLLAHIIDKCFKNLINHNYQEGNTTS